MNDHDEIITLRTEHKSLKERVELGVSQTVQHHNTLFRFLVLIIGFFWGMVTIIIGWLITLTMAVYGNN